MRPRRAGKMFNHEQHWREVQAAKQQEALLRHEAEREALTQRFALKEQLQQQANAARDAVIVDARNESVSRESSRASSRADSRAGLVSPTKR